MIGGLTAASSLDSCCGWSEVIPPGTIQELAVEATPPLVSADAVEVTADATTPEAILAGADEAEDAADEEFTTAAAEEIIIDVAVDDEPTTALPPPAEAADSEDELVDVTLTVEVAAPDEAIADGKV